MVFGAETNFIHNFRLKKRKRHDKSVIKIKRSKTNETTEDWTGKNLLCRDLVQLSSTKKKNFWLKNDKG